MRNLPAPALALIWSGVSLGGALVAAPAKFQAPSLELTTALEVGRAQFHWIGVTEAILCGLLILALFISRPTRWKWMLVPIVLFAIQRLALMPALDARTVDVINGAAAGETHLHLYFVVLEVLKLILLITASIISLRAIRSTA